MLSYDRIEREARQKKYDFIESDDEEDSKGKKKRKSKKDKKKKKKKKRKKRDSSSSSSSSSRFVNENRITFSQLMSCFLQCIW